jgi:TIR domain
MERPMAGPSDPAKPISLFYSYSHKDEELRLRLETHLAALRRSGLIAEWHDRKLEPGDAWKDEIDRHLTSADLVLLLVSSDFIASDYCWGEEMTKALARHARDEARVIPVILRHCRWRSTPLASLQAVPKDAKPIKSWPDEDEAFDDVVAAIERAVQQTRRRAKEERQRAEEEARQRAEEEARQRAEEETRQRAGERARRQLEENAGRRAAGMTQWRVQLSGDPRDLETLAAESQPAEWSIRRDGEQFMLTSSSFDPVADSSVIWAQADDLVARIDRAARLLMSSFSGIRTAALRRGRENDGSQINIYTRDVGAIRANETAELHVGLDGVGVAPTKVPVTPCPNLPDLVALQQTNSDFNEALSYLCDDNWHAYYNAFEALREAVGGERKVQQLGWASRNQISRFRQSAQPDRHHGRQPPKNPMSIPEGRGFIDDLLRKWARWERSKL